MIRCEICGVERPPLRARNENPLCDFHKRQRKDLQNKQSKRRKRMGQKLKYWNPDHDWTAPQFDWVKPKGFDLFIGVMNGLAKAHGK